MFLLFGGDRKKKWDTLEHNGPLFPFLYEPLNILVIYQGKEVLLKPKAEELQTIYPKL